MIFLGDLQLVENDIYRVGVIHYRPFDSELGYNLTVEELEQKGILVEELPIAESNRKNYSTFVNKLTKEITYEYSNELSIDDKIDILEKENADLLLDSAIKDNKLATFEKDLADLTLQIAGGIQ